MGTIRGCQGKATVDSNPLGEMRQWEYTETAERIDASIMGDCTKKFVAGAKETTGTFTCWWDIIADAGQAALLIGNSVALALHPAGTGTGLPELTGNATVTDSGGTAEVDGIVEATFSFALDGEWTRATQ